MDYVEGEDLESALQRTAGSLPEKPVLLWAEQVLDALEYLHGQRPRPIIHRDIKPANIRLTPQGKVKLVDFGLVKLLDPSDPRTKTMLQGMGTPEYAPLEQYASGHGHTDARSDIYSLGATLYHLLTDVAPPDIHSRMLKPGVLRPPRQRNPQLSENTERVVRRAIEIHPDQRYQSAREMKQALVGKKPAGPPSPAQRGLAQRFAPFLLVAILALLAGIVLRTVWRPKPSPTPTAATMVALVTNTATPAPMDTPTATNTLTATLIDTPTATNTPTATATATNTLTTTPTRAPTASPTTTATNTPSPSPNSAPTREPVIVYQPVPLGTAANASLDSCFLSPPTGNITLGGVPFQLSERVFKSQASPSPHNSYPTRILVSADVPQAHRVHLLLIAGNGLAQFNRMVIGRVVAYCNDVPIPVTELQLGRDIREWHAAEENLVSTASRAQQVWSGARSDFPNLTGHIDLLSLDLPETCQSERLTALEVIDSSTDTVNSLDPALNLIGVTVEYYR